MVSKEIKHHHVVNGITIDPKNIDTSLTWDKFQTFFNDKSTGEQDR